MGSMTGARTPQLLTVQETASRLSLSEREVHRLIANGRLRSLKIGTRRRVELAEVARFIESLRG